MGRPLTRAFVGCGLVVVALLVSILVAVLHQSPSPSPALPRPNGYDDFVKAGSLFGPTAADLTTLSQTQLVAVVGTNAEALALVRTGLTRQCQVPLDLSITNEVRVQRLVSLRRLSQLVVAQGRLAELENRPGDAAEAYLATVRLGQELGRGGLMIDALVGIAVETMGIMALERLVPSLDAAQCRTLAGALEAAEAKREPAQAFINEDGRWARMTFGWRYYYYRLAEIRTHGQTQKRFQARYAAVQLRNRVLQLTLAGRAYELEKGQRPQGPGSLVPAYLKAIPQDPVSGSNLVSVP